MVSIRKQNNFQENINTDTLVSVSKDIQTNSKPPRITGTKSRAAKKPKSKKAKLHPRTAAVLPDFLRLPNVIHPTDSSMFTPVLLPIPVSPSYPFILPFIQDDHNWFHDIVKSNCPSVGNNFNIKVTKSPKHLPLVSKLKFTITKILTFAMVPN